MKEGLVCRNEKGIVKGATMEDIATVRGLDADREKGRALFLLSNSDFSACDRYILSFSRRELQYSTI